MAFIKQIPVDEAEGQIGRLYHAASQRAGDVAQIIQVMSLDSASAMGSMGMYVSLMKSRNSLSPARREMLASVVSNANDCYY